MWAAIASLLWIGLTLLSLVCVPVFVIFRRNIRRKEQQIRVAPATDRAALIEDTLAFFRVDSQKLTPGKQCEIALAALRAREQLLTHGIYAAAILGWVGTLAMASGCLKSDETPSYPPSSQNQTNASAQIERIPSFPWPPPKASARVTLPAQHFQSATNFGQVDILLRRALDVCGCSEKSYYAVPGGFALVTQLEQINPDGTPKPAPDRWLIEIPPLRQFSLREYLDRLFRAPPGRFRIIVFIVTPYPFPESNLTVSRAEAMDLIPGGLNKLPAEIAQRIYSPAVTTTALVYEFDVPQTATNAVCDIPSSLTCQEHLAGAKLWGRFVR